MGNTVDMEKVLSDVEKYLIDQGYDGFVTKENRDANSIEVHDIPILITNLQGEKILVGDLADVSIQYTIKEDDGSYESMGTKFISFHNNEIKGFVSFDEVIGKRGWTYQGLSEEGFRNLLKIMMK